MGLLFTEMQYGRLQRWTLLPCTFSKWLCLQLVLHLVFIQSGMLVVVMGLRLESISVPQSGIKGRDITLSCEFLVDDVAEKLYSLKWYKDSHEFFRYMPQGKEPIQTFNRPGVQVDKNDHKLVSANRVTFKLKNLRLSSGGSYKCEISADAPTFKTLSNESTLAIIVLPTPPTPRLTGFPLQGQLGDRVKGNCTYVKSYPPANLTFYVNDVKVNNSESIRDIKGKMYEPQVDGVIEDYSYGSTSLIGGSSSNGIGRQYQYQQQHQQISSSSLGRDSMNNVQGTGPTHIGGGKENTYKSVSGIEFRLERHHFLRRGQVLSIRCIASVLDQSWDAYFNITLHNYQPPDMSTAGQNRYSSGSQYSLPLLNFASTTLLHKVMRLGILISTWTFLVC
ncbi:unnamed protein product [Orchesella dallaii]|uniref:Ig-like domain-containing protein n=1 Tax=Orchesella dallaii TaxID=48710 RepID=A0ABP1QBQ4_9HEXA